MLTVLENCRVSPPPATVGDKSLPLTFFDTVWLLFFPINQIFFYEFPHPKSYFLETIVPKLKHSLSITLQHFFPFAGNLICHKFYPLVPLLGQATKVSDYVTIPLFSVQVTLFPNKGIAIGLTNHHCLCDASTRFNFLKAWTSIAKHGTDELFLASGSLPFYERVIEYPESLEEIYFNQPGIETIDEGYEIPHLVGGTDKARATLVLTQAAINRGVCLYVELHSESACSNRRTRGDDVERFICPVDWRSRIHPPLPPTYFGNCVGPCISTLTKRSLLAGNKGFQTAAEVFGKALSETLNNKDALLNDAETWLERAYEPVPMIGVWDPKDEGLRYRFWMGEAEKA
ncbi:hypothetical protein L1987_58137 [Smallanthus sonchifolius]|uniref:Uncharacterized protein n=1 Tax=Smallanthus sonchifolius TaxID=185202 RepID=A0ACB9DER7_9ASTR|nr:hypothetical protein L1987_58137 [Smallanthus sonchifolius]